MTGTEQEELLWGPAVSGTRCSPGAVTHLCGPRDPTPRTPPAEHPNPSDYPPLPRG